MTKARLDPAKKMWGPQNGADGRPGGAWLTDPAGPGPLIVGEGIESSLSAGILHGPPCRIAAALSLGRLQGGRLTDRWGRFNPDAPQADPEAPAFTWPAAGAVVVAVDRDMAAVEVKVRAPLGGTVRRRLDSDARARLCGGLAAQHWRAARAGPVSVSAPPAGMDFNNWLMRGAA